MQSTISKKKYLAVRLMLKYRPALFYCLLVCDVANVSRCCGGLNSAK